MGGHTRDHRHTQRRRLHGICKRVIATEFWSIENNLSLSNMDFHEFADAVDEEGIFRGF
ncbi:DUF6924 domain-containing protein [Actinomadura alba]|uniref:DUF6924 domain-containing protein n=1 Tax=Actinomadura alba TaxID=406431 RepID=UPI0035E43544